MSARVALLKRTLKILSKRTHRLPEGTLNILKLAEESNVRPRTVNMDHQQKSGSCRGRKRYFGNKIYQ